MSKKAAGGSSPDSSVSWFQRNRRDLRFLAVFSICMGVYYAVSLLSPVRQSFFPAYLRLNAAVSGAILRMVGQDVSVTAQTIASSAGVSIDIARGCDAIEPSALFLAAVLASPVAFRSKLLAACWGVSALLLLNLVRIVNLFLVRAYYPSLFETMHLDVWQVLFIFAAIFQWALWASRVSKRDGRKTDAGA